MIEEVILDYLNEKLDIAVYTEVPEKPPKEYAIIEKISGGTDNHICSSAFAIQSVSDSLFHAAQLNEKVKIAMKDINELGDICRSDLNSDYNYTNTASKKYRYQAVFDIVHY